MTANPLAQPVPSTWLMPIQLEHYPERNPVLTGEEKASMNEYLQTPEAKRVGRRSQNILDQLARFNTIFLDVVNLSLHCEGPSLAMGRAHLFRFMLQTDQAFWAWSRETWIEVIQTAPPPKDLRGVRFWMRNMAYLLCDFLYAGPSANYGMMANTIFGAALINTEVDKLHAPLLSLGYSKQGGENAHFRWICTLTMLVHRSPDISTFSPQTLLQVDEFLATLPSATALRERQFLLKLQTALCHLEILESPVLSPRDKVEIDYPALWKNDTALSPAWVAWVCAFFEQTPQQHENTIRAVCYNLLTAGRWLNKTHPEITEPAQWTEALANEYVTYTCNAFRGDQMPSSSLAYAQHKNFPQKLAPTGINARLAGMRFFFFHLQRRTYIIDGKVHPKLQITWLPHEAFKTPGDVKAAIQPNPRDIQEDTWFKLIWAACTLSKETLLEARICHYPLAYYRAACLVWVTAARRSDEIRRLSVGCVRREWAPEMYDEHGDQIEPETELCYLRVPANKMRGDFYVPIPPYVADAIEVWEQARPANQQAFSDRKTHKPVQYLFQYRDELMGKYFLNKYAIPLLCKHAGVDQIDVVGRITSHRARATIATWMRKMGMTPTDIGTILGHTNPAKSLPWYLREDKHHLGRVYRKANPLERYVAAILDTNAQAKQEPCVFYYLADGPEGRPRMCGNPHFSRCIHQMTCVECEAFIDTEMAQTIEKREGTIIISVPIPLPPQVVEHLNEQDEGGISKTLENSSPPPKLPSPAFHFNKKVPPLALPLPEEDLSARKASLEAQIAKRRGKADRRSASLRALYQELSEITARIQEEERKADEETGR